MGRMLSRLLTQLEKARENWGILATFTGATFVAGVSVGLFADRFERDRLSAGIEASGREFLACRDSLDAFATASPLVSPETLSSLGEECAQVALRLRSDRDSLVAVARVRGDSVAAITARMDSLANAESRLVAIRARILELEEERERLLGDEDYAARDHADAAADSAQAAQDCEVLRGQDARPALLIDACGHFGEASSLAVGAADRLRVIRERIAWTEAELARLHAAM